MSFNIGRGKHVIAAAKELSRKLRATQTKAEKIIWSNVRNRKFLGLKFYRQHPIFYDFNNGEKFFILDFYCHERKLDIEIDGEGHEYRQEEDSQRTEILEGFGITVLRFKNEEVEKDIKSILEKIELFLTHPKSLS